MRAINHALTGAIIGLSVAEPIIALPAALVSHFVLDAIPHWGFKRPTAGSLRSQSFKLSLILDALLCFVLVLAIFYQRPINWLLVVICAFVAAAPDLISIGRYRKALEHKPHRPNFYEKFATGIQWFEKPIGLIVQIVWFSAGILVLVALLGK